MWKNNFPDLKEIKKSITSGIINELRAYQLDIV